MRSPLPAIHAGLVGTSPSSYWRDSYLLGWASISLFALLWRMATFGNPTLHVDDQFYAMVGQQMHQGMLPYVDIWDRKPFGLFLLYYAIAAVSFEPLAFQIAAWLAAAGTGCVVYCISRYWSSGRGAFFAGLIYIAFLHISGGEGGQAPVFYNLPVAIAVLALVRWLAQAPVQPDRNVWLAMGMLGIALTIKQTVIFEAAALGTCVLWQLLRTGSGPLAIIRTAIPSAMLGAGPTLLCFAFFALAGHFDVFWHAMFLSNLHKEYPDIYVMGARALLAVLATTPLMAPFALSFIGQTGPIARFRWLLMTWLLAAVVGVVSLPNFYLHYFLPLWLPVAVLSSPALDRRYLGPILALACLAYSALNANPFNFAWNQRSRQEVAAASALINRLDHGETMLVFEGPIALYRTTGRHFLSPLVFTTHLNWRHEFNVSHLETNRELERILARRPDVVVSFPRPRSKPANKEGWRLVDNYIRTYCSWHRRKLISEIYRSWRTDLYGGCGAGEPRTTAEIGP